MGIDLSALATNADKLDECIDKNKKREQDRKDEQLYGIIERKVKKEEHKREKPRSRDGTLKKCRRLFEEGASSEVLTKLEESLRGQEKYYRYYVQCFLPVLGKLIKQSKKISNETKEQAISEITYNSKYCSNSITHNQNDRRNSEDSEAESGYGSDVEDDHKVEISNEITNSNALLLKAIKNGNNRKFKKYLKDCTNVNGIKDEKGNNILHLIASLEKKQKCKFLGALIKTVTEEDLAQLVDSKNSKSQDALQVALINKITKEKHESHTIQDNDNTLKFLTKLLEHGASHDQLELPEESLKKLSKGQNEYYCKFLKKLAKKAELKQEIKIKTEAKVKEIVAHTVNTPNSNSDYPLHLAIKNNDKELFKELLQEGANISLEGANKNNALHHIALLKGEYKIKYLKLILDFEKKGVISSEKLHKAINAQNKDDKYPAQVALIRQTEKIPSKLKDFSRWVRSRPTKHYYTAEFCAELLQNGAENKSDHITIPKEHRKQKYYQTTKRIKDITGVSPDPETQEELEEHFSKKNARKNISLPVKWILGGLIFATVFSALAGNMIAAAALSVTIAVCAMCYPIYLKLENALNARASDQSEHTENPATKMSDVSILRQFMNKLDGLTNKPSSLAL